MKMKYLLLIFGFILGMVSVSAYVVDDFNRGDSASPGYGWNTSYFGTVTYKITGNKLNITAVDTAYGNIIRAHNSSYSINCSAKKWDIYMDFKPISTSDYSNFAFVICGNRTDIGDASSSYNTGWWFNQPWGTASTAELYYGSSIATSASSPVSTNVWYKIRFYSDGNKYRYKIWQNGTTEPSLWKMESSVYGTPSTMGYMGLRSGRANAVSAVDNLISNTWAQIPNPIISDMIFYVPFDDSSSTELTNNMQHWERQIVYSNSCGKVGGGGANFTSQTVSNITWSTGYDNYRVNTYNLWYLGNISSGGVSRALGHFGQAQRENTPLTNNSYFLHESTGAFGNEAITAYSDTGTARDGVLGITQSFGWHMITFRWNSTIARYDIFLDGTKQTVSVANSWSDSARTFNGYGKLGMAYPYGIGSKSCYDELAVWNRSLSNSEISELYNSSNGMSLSRFILTGNESIITSYYPSTAITTSLRPMNLTLSLYTNTTATIRFYINNTLKCSVIAYPGLLHQTKYCEFIGKDASYPFNITINGTGGTYKRNGTFTFGNTLEIRHYTFKESAVSTSIDYGKEAANSTNVNLASGGGKLGKGVKFDAYNDELGITPNSGSEIYNLNGDNVSISFWINRTAYSAGTSDRFFVAGTPLGSTNWIYILGGGPNTNAYNLYGQVSNNGGTSSSAWTTIKGSYIDSKWHHITFTYQKYVSGLTNNAKIYVDGVLVNTSTYTQSSATNGIGTNFEFIGGYDASRVHSYSLDDVRVYTKVLTPGEIYRLYNFGSGTEAPLDTISDTTLPILSYSPVSGRYIKPINMTVTYLSNVTATVRFYVDDSLKCTFFANGSISAITKNCIYNANDGNYRFNVTINNSLGLTSKRNGTFTYRTTEMMMYPFNDASAATKYVNYGRNVSNATECGNVQTAVGKIGSAVYMDDTATACSGAGGRNRATVDLSQFNVSGINYQNLSYSFWYYRTDTPNYVAGFTIYRAGTFGNDQFTIDVDQYTDGSLQIYTFESNTGTQFKILTTPVLSINTWYHIAYTLDNTTTTNNVKAYINGVLVDQDNYTYGKAPSAISTYHFLSAGTAVDRSTSWRADDFRFYRKTLSPAEISQIYNGGAGTEAPLGSIPSVTGVSPRANAKEVDRRLPLLVNYTIYSPSVIKLYVNGTKKCQWSGDTGSYSVSCPNASLANSKFYRWNITINSSGTRYNFNYSFTTSADAYQIDKILTRIVSFYPMDAITSGKMIDVVRGRNASEAGTLSSTIGKFGNSISTTDGLTNWAYINASGLHTFDNVSFSVASWAYITTMQNYNRIASKGSNSSSNQAWQMLYYNPSTAWYHGFYGNDLSMTKSTSTGAWYLHIVGYNVTSNHRELYVSGTYSNDTSSADLKKTNNHPIALFRTFLTGNTEDLKGRLDEFAIFRGKPLTRSESGILYNNNTGVNLSYHILVRNRDIKYKNIYPLEGEQINESDLNITYTSETTLMSDVKIYVDDTLKCTNYLVMNGTDLKCDPGTLSDGPHSWYAIVSNGVTSYTTSEYNFTIGEGILPIYLTSKDFYPANNSLNINPQTRLSFYANSSNTTATILSKFTIYNGTIYSTYSNTTGANQYIYYSLPLLKYNHTYYWNISINNSQSYNISGIYNFMTAEQPLVTILYPSNTSYNLLSLDLKYTIKNSTTMDKCWYSKDYGVTNSTRVNAFTNFTNVIASVGSNTWYVYCNDTNNYVASDWISFTSNVSAPHLTVYSPTNTTYGTLTKQAVIDINFTADSYTKLWYINHNTCYQETANISTSCGGLATGKYSFSGSWVNANNTVDGNYDTFGSGTTGLDGYLYVNYSKPTNARGAVWKTKHYEASAIATTSLDIPQSCWDYYADKLELYIYSECTGGLCTKSIAWFCKDNTGWNAIDFTYGGSTQRVYEEAIYWYDTDQTNTPEIITNYTSPTNITLPVGHYKFSFYANNSVGLTNSSIVYFTISNASDIKITIGAPNATIKTDQVIGLYIRANTSAGIDTCNYSITGGITGFLSYSAGYWTTTSSNMNTLGSKTLVVSCYDGDNPPGYQWGNKSFTFNLEEYVIKPNMTNPLNYVYYNASNLPNLTGSVLSSQTVYCQNFTSDDETNPLSIQYNSTPQTGISIINCDLGATETAGSPIYNTYKIIVKNSNGYNSTNSTSRSFYYDSSKPDVDIGSPTSSSYDNEVSLYIDYGDTGNNYNLKRVWYNVKGTDYVHCDSITNIPYSCTHFGTINQGPYSMPPGSNTIYAYATDMANNTNASSVTFTINALYLNGGDTNGTVYNALAPNPPYDYATNANDECTFTLNNVLRDTYLPTPNMQFSFYSPDITPYLLQGRNNISVFCNNTYGSTVTKNYWIIYATRIPHLDTIIPKNNHVYNTSNFTMIFNVTSPFNVTSITYSFEYDGGPAPSGCDGSGQTSGTYTGPFMFDPVITPGSNCDGKYNLKDFQASDEYGNTNTTPNPFLSFYINAYYAELVIDKPLNTSYLNIGIPFQANATTAYDKMWYTLTGNSTKNYINNATTYYRNLSAGSYTAYYYINDSFNRVSSYQVSFTVGYPSFYLTKIYPPDGINYSYINYTNGDPWDEVNYSVSPTNSSIVDCYYFYNGGTIYHTQNPGFGETSFNLLTYNNDGINTYNISCNNTYDQTGIASGYFYIDFLRPSILINSPANNSRHNDTSILVNISITDTRLDKAYLIIEDDVNCGDLCANITPMYFNYTTPFMLNLTDNGMYQITIFANDTFHNNITKISKFQVDFTRPMIILYEPLNTSNYKNSSAVPFNISFYDTNLYGFNVTCSHNGTVYYSAQMVNLTNRTYDFYDTHLFNEPALYSCQVLAADDHTDRKFETKVKSKVLGFGEHKLDFDNGKAEFIFDSRNKYKLDSLSYEVKEDRVSPIIKIKDPKKGEYVDLYWTLRTTGKIYDRSKKSGIPGHIVIIPATGLKDAYWYDAETELESDGYDIDYEIVDNEAKFHMRVKPDKLENGELKTKSIGGLNIEILNFNLSVVSSLNVTFDAIDYFNLSNVPFNFSITNGTDTWQYYDQMSVSISLLCEDYTVNMTNVNYYNNFTRTFDGCNASSYTARFWEAELNLYTKNNLGDVLITGINLNITGPNYTANFMNTANPSFLVVPPGNYTINATSDDYGTNIFNVIVPPFTTINYYMNLTPTYFTQFYREETNTPFNFVEASTPYQCANGTIINTSYQTQQIPSAYKCSGNFSATNVCIDSFDGDGETYAEANPASIIYLNYTKPIEADNTTRFIVQKDIIRSETYKMSDYQTCWIQSKVQFRLNLNTTSLNTKLYCKNSTGWNLMDTYPNGGLVYDTRIEWGYDTTQTRYSTCQNITNMYFDVSIYCPDTVLEYIVDNAHRSVGNVSCPYDYWLIQAHYSNEVYFRTLIPPYSQTNTSIYMLDLNYDDAVQVIVKINDLAELYNSAIIKVYKYIGEERVSVIQQYVDMEKKATLWLDKNANYELCVVDDDGLEACYGSLYVDAASTKILTLPAAPVSDFSSAGNNIKWRFMGNKAAGTVTLEYVDTSDNGYSKMVWRVKDSNGAVVASTTRYNGKSTYVSLGGLNEYSTYYTELNITHKDRTPIYEQIPLWAPSGTNFPGWSARSGIVFKLLVAILVPLLMFLIFSTVTIEFGTTVAMFTLVVFMELNWYGTLLGSWMKRIIEISVILLIFTIFWVMRRKQ